MKLWCDECKSFGNGLIWIPFSADQVSAAVNIGVVVTEDGNFTGLFVNWEHLTDREKVLVKKETTKLLQREDCVECYACQTPMKWRVANSYEVIIEATEKRKYRIRVPGEKEFESYIKQHDLLEYEKIEPLQFRLISAIEDVAK